MWLSWFAVGALAPLRLPVPPVVRWAGLGAVLVGAGVSVAGILQLGGVENIDHLVATGLFSRIRHPMYAGFALWILGWCAYAGAVTSLLLAPFGLVSVLWWRQLEESELSERYGSEYAEYRAATWILAMGVGGLSRVATSMPIGRTGVLQRGPFLRMACAWRNTEVARSLTGAPSVSRSRGGGARDRSIGDSA